LQLQWLRAVPLRDPAKFQALAPGASQSVLGAVFLLITLIRPV
jgi:hypothetical protein